MNSKSLFSQYGEFYSQFSNTPCVFEQASYMVSFLAIHQLNFHRLTTWNRCRWYLVLMTSSVGDLMKFRIQTICLSLHIIMNLSLTLMKSEDHSLSQTRRKRSRPENEETQSLKSTLRYLIFINAWEMDLFFWFEEE